MNELFRDELYCIAKTAVKRFADLSGAEVNIYCDGHSLASYLAAALLSVCDGSVKALGMRDDPLLGEITDRYTPDRLKLFSAGDDIFASKTGDSQVYFFFADLSELECGLSDMKKKLGMWLKERDEQGGAFIFVPIFNFTRTHKEGITALAEGEITALINSSDSPEEKALGELEKICADSFRKSGGDIMIVRFDNVFGPLVRSDSKLHIDEIITELKEKNSITIKKSDYAVTYTGCYVREAVEALLLVLEKGRVGNIYNAASCEFTLWDIKSSLLKRYKDNNPKVTFIDDEGENGYKKLDTRKLKALGFEVTSDLEDALYRTACAATGEEYKGGNLTDIYCGKLDRIKSLELDMMAVIDKICRENDISYFLVGGSLLGAVRHKGFIPWDDDIDIGMLREDFEKFRKICPEQLPSHLMYQTYESDPESHYVFDKIRLRGTYFSTVFSGQFADMENGVFVDILVYDSTANSPLIQKMHIKLVRLFTFMLNVRWLGKDNHTGLKGLAVRMMKALPFAFYHKLLDSGLKIFRHSKKSRYLIDGVGQYLTAGAFPAEWYDRLIDMKYENMTLKAPRGYDGYLRHWYGDKYMELLPPSRRASGHPLSRLDLGDYLYEPSGASGEKENFQDELYL